MVVHNVWGWNEDRCPGIWNYSINPYNSASQRNLLMANMYRDLGADIILLQEYTNRLMRVEANHDISPLMESYGYAQIKGPMIEGIYTATPIFYRTDKLELLESGVTKFSVGGGHDKFATWGVFKQKSDGKVFGAISVHMAYQGGTEGENYRLAQVPVVNSIADLIRVKHNNCPVMVGGDMNCTSTSNPFKLYLSKGFVDVQGLAARKDGGRSYFSGPNWDKDKNIFTNDVRDIATYAGAIDHLIYKGDSNAVTFNVYDYLTESAAASIADHMPLVVDFDLN
jgi:endonuclease/exonuclease/phosphatase family metal-dependent hydrolase